MEPTKMQEKSPECENNKEERATHSIWTTQLTEDVPGDLLGRRRSRPFWRRAAPRKMVVLPLGVIFLLGVIDG